MLNWNISTLLEITVRTALVYVLIIILLRLTGKQELGQLNPIDLVLLLLLANAVQNAMTGPDTSLTGGMVAAITLIILSMVLSVMRGRSRLFGKVLQGSPTLLVHNGKLMIANLAREHLAQDDVEEALREHGIGDISQCQDAVLEVDGSISVIPKDDGSGKPTVLHGRHRRRQMQRHS
jgi:uncharacterized membrane protein YcaP (DUF421 family)